MSGGSLDYIYQRLNTVIEEIQSYYNDKYCPIHGSSPYEAKYELTRKLKEHLMLVSEALHAIEWVMSDDKAHEEEMPSIKKLLDNRIT